MNTKIYGNKEYEFEGVNISYVVSVGIDVEKNRYFMPSLSFYKERGTKKEVCLEIWDNEDYILETLYKKVLKPWTDNKELKNPKAFSELLQIPGFHLDDFPYLLKLIEISIKEQFYEERGF